MQAEEKELWSKIDSFKLDDDSASFQFSHRLARDNGWTILYANKVIEEYKKFIFLCCVTQTGVTPSDQVDQAWHLHLTYTRSYWIDLCKTTLQKEIHHNPTKGGKNEGSKFNDFYSGTIELYTKKFGIPPPKEIWPDNETRFSDINFQRINLKDYWLLRIPKLNRKKIILFLIVFISLFCIQATSIDKGTIVILLVFVGFVIYESINNKNGGNGGNGCSSGSGCGHGHSGCSGDGGCSGCGGCGGD